jgi:two-component system chemotaxis response regulator CheB
LVKDLPAELPAALLVVLHIPPDSPGYLPQILAGSGALPTSTAADGALIEPGNIYVAPPDHHLLVNESGRMQTTRGPKENRARPAIDPLFRSAAAVYGRRVIGVILTGALNDGTAGLYMVKNRGGTAIVQDPRDAVEPSMPRSALENVDVDYCEPLHRIAQVLVHLTHEELQEVPEMQPNDMPKELEIEIKIARGQHAREAGITKLGDPSMFTCPECHGTLLKLRDEHPLRFRCHTGHAFTADSLLAGLTESIDQSLWSSVRSLEENVMLLRHMAEYLAQNSRQKEAQRFATLADRVQLRADLVRQAASQQEHLSISKVVGE